MLDADIYLTRFVCDRGGGGDSRTEPAAEICWMLAAEQNRAREAYEIQGSGNS
jgi:hypothetical protein